MLYYYYYFNYYILTNYIALEWKVCKPELCYYLAFGLSSSTWAVLTPQFGVKPDNHVFQHDLRAIQSESCASVKVRTSD